MSTEHATAESGAPIATPASPPYAPPTGQVLGVVAAHIEPVTRFDARDLTETAPEEAYGLPVELTVDQYVSFSERIGSGPARLPAGVDKVGSQQAFRQELAERLDTAETEAPRALQAWANGNAGSYRRLMPGTAGFLRSPGSVGYEHTCHQCHGACHVTCPSCSGVGHTNCHACFGAGKINCYSCHGSKQQTCSSCGGRGSWTEQVSQQTWSSSSNSYVTTYQTVYRNCSACSSSGRTTCYHCGYDGKINCSGCFGKGHIDCGRCGTTGRIDCASCLASGIEHVRGTIVAEVVHDETLSIVTPDETLRKLVDTKVPREDMPQLGELLDVLHTVQGHAVETRHRLRLDVRRASLRARDDDFVLYGFGPEARVFSFDNIAGHLLTDDLEALEARVATSSAWRRHKGSDLLDTTADFLRSELNMLIAERVADAKASPEDAAAAVETHFKGLVDQTYVARATTALRTALARLYGSELTEPAAYLCGLTALAAGALYGTGWPAPGVWQPVLWSVGGAALAWLALEWATRRRIAKRFEAGFGQRVLDQLKANGSVKRWRIGLAVAAPMAAVLAIQGTGMLPFVRSHHTLQQARADAQMLLAQWPMQFEPDLRLRTYPAEAVLEEQAQAGQTQAQLILAWQKLLGAGGATKDVAGAARLLEQAAPQARESSLWQAAKAVQLLNQEALPDDIRAAAQDLDRAADKGLVEARYWQARILLAEQSPLHDARQGLRVLTQAADKGHAHAALMLGNKLAKGEDTRRDVRAARRYLQQAAGKGLTEANEALQKL